MFTRTSALSSKATRLDRLAFWLFALGTGLSAFRPVAHYAPWGVALILALVQKCVWDVPLTPPFSRAGRWLFGLAAALCGWCALGSALGAPTVGVGQWAHGWSFFADFLMGLWLAARLSGTEARRNRLVWAIFGGFLVITAAYGYRLLFVRSGYMNNADDLGFWGIVISLIIWQRGLCLLGRPWGQGWRSAVRGLGASVFMAFCWAAGTTVLFLSFSSGAWVGAAVQLVLLLALSRLKWQKALWALCLLAVVGLGGFWVADRATHGATVAAARREMDQLLSVKQANKAQFTSGRSIIWRATWAMIEQRPWTGWAEDFTDAYAANYPATAKRLGLPTGFEQATYSHNLYLDVLFRSGFIGLALLMAFAALGLVAAWPRLWRSVSETDRSWALMAFAFLGGQLIYGLSNTVFQFRRDMGAVAWVLMGLLALLPRPPLPLPPAVTSDEVHPESQSEPETSSHE